MIENNEETRRQFRAEMVPILKEVSKALIDYDLEKTLFFFTLLLTHEYGKFNLSAIELVEAQTFLGNKVLEFMLMEKGR